MIFKKSKKTEWDKADRWFGIGFVHPVAGKVEYMIFLDPGNGMYAVFYFDGENCHKVGVSISLSGAKHLAQKSLRALKSTHNEEQK